MEKIELQMPHHGYNNTRRGIRVTVRSYKVHILNRRTINNNEKRKINNILKKQRLIETIEF